MFVNSHDKGAAGRNVSHRSNINQRQEMLLQAISNQDSTVDYKGLRPDMCKL